jgi:hypothetical protein
VGKRTVDASRTADLNNSKVYCCLLIQCIYVKSGVVGWRRQGALL